MRRTLIGALALVLAADSSPFTTLLRPDLRDPLPRLERLASISPEEVLAPEQVLRAPLLIGLLLREVSVGYDVTRDFRRKGIKAPNARGYAIAGDEYVADVAGPVGCDALFDAWHIPAVERPATRSNECLLFNYRQRCLKEESAVDAMVIFHLPSGEFLIGNLFYPGENYSSVDEARSFRAYGDALREIEARMLAGNPPLPY